MYLYLLTSCSGMISMFTDQGALYPFRCVSCTELLEYSQTHESSFQIIVESNDVIVIAALSDWLKRLAQVFQPMRSKTKTNHTMYTSFFPRFERVTGNC